MSSTLKNQIVSFLGGMLIASGCIGIVAANYLTQASRINENREMMLKIEISKRDSVNEQNKKINASLTNQYDLIIRPMKKRK